MQNKAGNVDAYIHAFPEETQIILQKIRETIRKAAPQAEEKISYAIPTFTINGKYVIYFAGYKHHVSIYPAPREAPEFKSLLAGYRGGKGTVQFPLDQPIPYSLITKMVKWRIKKNVDEVILKKALRGNSKLVRR